MSEILFTHRPAAGVSVAATSVLGVLYVAFALTNDGTSRKQYFYPERRDSFSRATARSILRGRLERMVEAREPVNLGIIFATDMEARKFIEAFRKTFKPTEDESDTFLNEELPEFTSPNGTHCDAIRWRLSPKQIVDKLTSLASLIITDTVNA